MLTEEKNRLITTEKEPSEMLFVLISILQMKSMD